MSSTTTDSPSGHDDVDYGVFVWLAERLRTTPRRAEWLVGALLAVAAAIFMCRLVPDIWFGSDELEFLTDRTAFDPGDLARPFGGHWTTWAILEMRGLYRVFGLDWWPWYFIPRLIGLTLVMTYIWRVVRARGADPLVGILAYASLLVLGPAAYQRAHQLGSWVVYGVLITCALIISRRTDPSPRDRVVVGVLLLVAVLGNGYAVAVIGGISVALLLARRLVVWLPSLAPALFAYLAWWLRFRRDIKPKVELDVGKILGIPGGAFRVVTTAVESATNLPEWAAGLAVLALVGWIVSLIVRRRLDLFDSIILFTLGIGLALLSIQRISIDSDAADALRYGTLVTILLSLALVPHIRVAATPLAKAAVVVIGLWVLGVNVQTTRDSIALRVENGREHQPQYVAAATLLLAGEPSVAGPSTLSPGLETDELQQLINDAYSPDPLPQDRPDRDQLIEEARGALRMNPIDRRRPRDDFVPPPGVAPTTDAPLDADGCVTLAEGEPVTATVTDAGTLGVVKEPDQALLLTWTDDYGVGTRRFDDPDIRRAIIELAPPDGEAEMTLESDVGELRVCGFDNLRPSG